MTAARGTGGLSAALVWCTWCSGTLARFVEPILGVSGRLGLWKPDDELLHQIGDRLVATMVDRSQR
ncbi:MAG: hypothetical protein H6515_14385 [Microthrixaceae bacterium]|nr:hypothetical protein [Microthrixaceae bacterium]